MRAHRTFVHRSLAAALGCALFFACSGDEKPSGSGEPQAGSGGSGNASATGGTSSGGSAGTAAGDGSGGTSGGGGMPSAGCRAGGTATSGRFPIDVSGTMRDYILELPEGYDPTHPYRLIFAFHGGMYSAQTVADGGPPGSGPYYGIQAAAGGTAIFVAPQALTGSWTNQNGRDVAYVNAMIERFKAELCIDEDRIFSTGFSMGAIMTLALGCTTNGVFRAIAPMSGSLRDACDAPAPIAYWSSHGTNDTTITSANGEAARDRFVEANGCSSTTAPGAPEGCVSYEGCGAGTPVTWCAFTGAHVPAPYAGEAIWEFFAQF